MEGGRGGREEEEGDGRGREGEGGGLTDTAVMSRFRSLSELKRRIARPSLLDDVRVYSAQDADDGACVCVCVCARVTRSAQDNDKNVCVCVCDVVRYYISSR